MSEKDTTDKLDAILTHMKSLHERQDAFEKRIDSACQRLDSYDAEKARKDAEAKARKDANEGDAAARADADLPGFIEAQTKAERVYQAFGDSAGAPRWMHGDTVPQYRRRLLSKFKQFSPQWKDVDLAKVEDPQALGVAETAIYDSAMQASADGSLVPIGSYRAIKKPDAAGRIVTEFVGAEDAVWGQFTYFPNQIRAGKIVRPEGYLS